MIDTPGLIRNRLLAALPAAEFERLFAGTRIRPRVLPALTAIALPRFQMASSEKHRAWGRLAHNQPQSAFPGTV
jgi:hypothetical protein